MDDNHFYRSVAAEMLIQAIRIAKGEITNVNRSGPERNARIVEERSDAINFIMGAEFEFWMELLGAERGIDKAREDVRKSWYQPALIYAGNVGYWKGRIEMISEQTLNDLGFESVQEFYDMVAAVDLSSIEKQKAFNSWKENDGTKDGLLKLEIKENKQ